VLNSRGYESVVVVFQDSSNRIHESDGRDRDRGHDHGHGHGYGHDDDRGDGCDCDCDHDRGLGDCGSDHGRNHPECGDYVRTGHVRYGHDCHGYDHIGCGHDQAGGGHDDRGRGYHVYDGPDESVSHNLASLAVETGLEVELKFEGLLPGHVVLILHYLRSQDLERPDVSS
jgi:hypothetical protein